MSQLSYEPWFEYRNRVKRITFKQTTLATPVPSEVLFYSGDIRYFYIFSEINGYTVGPPVPPPNGGGSTGDGNSGNGDVQPPTGDGEGDRLRIVLVSTIGIPIGTVIIYNATIMWARVVFPNLFKQFLGGVVVSSAPTGAGAAVASGIRSISTLGGSANVVLESNPAYVPSEQLQQELAYGYAKAESVFGS